MQTEKQGGSIAPTSVTAGSTTSVPSSTMTANKPKVQSSVRRRLANKIGIKFK
jgi:hypothetical protein